MHTDNTKIFHDTHTLKSSFETYKNALKNMYIDIFICIQIGPSQQKQTHIPFICLSFAKGGFFFFFFSTETRRQRNEWNGSVLTLGMLRSNLQGRENP